MVGAEATRSFAQSGTEAHPSTSTATKGGLGKEDQMTTVTEQEPGPG
jgi:hypothetical protein